MDKDFVAVTVPEALSCGRELPWAWIRTLSSVYLGLMPADFPETELIEARFFSPEEEIRLFWSDGSLRAVRLRPDAGDREIERTFAIENRMFGRTLTVRYGLATDEDGQMYKKCARLAGWEG